MRWQRDGRQLIYYGYDNTFMSVPIGIGSVPKIGAAVPLFEAPVHSGAWARTGTLAQWDITPDGRFLVNVQAEESAPVAINVIVNWKTLLNK